MTKIANVEQAQAWDGAEGSSWAEHPDRYDLTASRHSARLLEAARVAATDHILDIGCGNGRTTIDAARLASAGAALGVDLASRMLANARARAEAEGVTNVTFEQGDAQVHPFDADTFDLVISRFGSMFFNDPAAAFANVASSMRPGGRLTLVSWRPLEENEWIVTLRSTFAEGRELPAPQPGVPGMMGHADPALVRGWLGEAGFDEIAIDPVDEPVLLGSDAEDAIAFVREIGFVRGILADLDEAARARTFERLRETLVAHQTPAGVAFASGAWLISARRR